MCVPLEVWSIWESVVEVLVKVEVLQNWPNTDSVNRTNKTVLNMIDKKQSIINKFHE